MANLYVHGIMDGSGCGHEKEAMGGALVHTFITTMQTSGVARCAESNSSAAGILGSPRRCAYGACIGKVYRCDTIPTNASCDLITSEPSEPVKVSLHNGWNTSAMRAPSHA